ncbi:hypothetical protein ASE48_07825 [Mycobacterium sp. Root265]|uniref:hypothetical protein n=1 Tax=Mycobacterium sp. Root265 TaxID=1736504 RepID=UPI00070C083A|nr:hypothetical protein [Mycobacterium sp. Root265]KRD08478.1 hypothetical protein ASE48_07825 [Mycobacterium sp. Root265]
MSVEDELATLYGVPPEEFTALRKELANAAKKRGDNDAARVIAAARRPTTAAWVVNELIRSDRTAKDRIAELNAQLRAAHAAMDGVRIRELSTQQRKLVSQLARTGFAAVGMPNPSAAIREDVTGTLQAAIADPEVAKQLGRLEKAQEWSGFGDFGAPTESASPRRKAEPEPAPEPKVDRRAAEKRRRALAAAQRAHHDATAAVSDRTTALATARRRYEEVLHALSTAEQAVASAEEQLQRANVDLDQADSALAELRGESPT